ncbi:MAG TPA: RidA family protein [Roseateles sp.]|uniref:RidA family protein n=1 Tax=Roseateles sp. TaxID=1971397 RepID=UPI002EDA9815
MTHKQILQPAGWTQPRGYANGVAASGRQVFVAGQIGWNERCEFDSDDLIEQVRQTLANIRAVLAEAGATPGHIVRMTWYLVDKREYLARGREVGQAYRDVLGRDYGVAMSAVQVSALMEDRAKVEIEVTAVVPDLGQ